MKNKWEDWFCSIIYRHVRMEDESYATVKVWHNPYTKQKISVYHVEK